MELKDLIGKLEKASTDTEKRLALSKAMDFYPDRVKTNAETLEQMVRETIRQLLELWQAIDAGESDGSIEEKGSVYDANDYGHCIEEGDDVQVPPPPGTIDPNATGIPDNSRKEKDGYVELTAQVDANDPDHPPYINESVYPIKTGDWVSWESPLGRSYGKVDKVQPDGQVEIPDSNLAMIAVKEDPVCITRIYRNDKGEGWSATDTLIGLKMSVLHRIDPLEPPKPIAPTIPNSQMNSYQSVLNRKGLSHIKVLDNGMCHVTMKAAFVNKSQKDLGSADVPSYRNSYEVTDQDKSYLTGFIPEGSVCADIQACDMEVDRGSEQFENQALNTFSKMYPGKPMLIDHEWSAKTIIGKVLKAENQNGKLVVRSFFPNTDNNKWVVDNIKTQIFTMVSVGFAAQMDNMRCSVCSKAMADNTCPHQPGELLKNGDRVVLRYRDIDDVFELSVIPVPMQQGSHIKSSNSNEIVSIEELPGASEITFAEKKIKTKSLLDQIIPPVGTPGDESCTPDIINSDIHTIGNSLKMSDNQPNEKVSDNLAGIVSPGGEGAIQTNELQPTGAIDPPAAGTLDNPVTDMKSEEEEKAAKDDMDKDKSYEALHTKMDEMSKMFGTYVAANENFNSFCKTLTETLKDVSEKCNEMHGIMKAPVGVSVESKDSEKDAELSLKFAEALTVINKKLDLAMSASTEGIKKLLSEDNVPKTAGAVVQKQNWVRDYFGTKNDLGGQQ